MLDLEPVQLHDQLTIADKALVLWAGVRALTAQQSLVELAAGLNIRTAESGAPEQHDQHAKPVTVRSTADHAHDATISSLVGGSDGYSSPLFAVGGLGDSRALSPVSGDGLRHSAARIP